MSCRKRLHFKFSIVWFLRILNTRCRVFALKGFMNNRTTLRGQITARISNQKEDVFLPREFYDLGGQDQVLRALRYMVRDGELVKMGYGLYCKAFRSKITGNIVLSSPNGFSSAARQALDKLGIQWKPCDAEIDYNERRSTQIPANNLLKIKGRFSRKIKYNSSELLVEKY